MNSTNLANEIIEQALFRLKENTPRIERCLNELSEDDLWKSPNNSSNSVGNLMLHLCGNITQYIISFLGEKEDQRERALEFTSTKSYNKVELLNKLKRTLDEAIDIIKNLNEEHLLKVQLVQGFRFSGIGIIIHAVEHYSYHTGQIAFWTKFLKNKDLGFYSDLDLNKKNVLLK